MNWNWISEIGNPYSAGIAMVLFAFLFYAIPNDSFAKVVGLVLVVFGVAIMAAESIRRHKNSEGNRHFQMFGQEL